MRGTEDDTHITTHRQAVQPADTPTTGRLFDDETLERFHRVMPLVDMLNRKYGRDTVRLAGMNPKGRWGTKAAKRSPRYTRKLSEVPRLR